MDPSGLIAAGGAAVVGAFGGWFVPAWVARLPEPMLEEGEEKPPYAELASWPRLRLVAVLCCAVAAGLTGLGVGATVALPAYVYLCVAGTVLAYVDLRVHRLPNAVVLPSYVVVGVLLAVAGAWSGEWDRLLWAAVGLAGLWGLFFLMLVVYPAGMGFGDVKLAGLLGLPLGWLGLGQLVLGLFAAFLLGGLTSIGLLIARRANRGTAIPFGPFLLLGFVVAVLLGGPLVTWYVGPHWRGAPRVKDLDSCCGG